MFLLAFQQWGLQWWSLRCCISRGGVGWGFWVGGSGGCWLIVMPYYLPQAQCTPCFLDSFIIAHYSCNTVTWMRLPVHLYRKMDVCMYADLPNALDMYTFALLCACVGVVLCLWWLQLFVCVSGLCKQWLYMFCVVCVDIRGCRYVVAQKYRPSVNIYLWHG